MPKDPNEIGALWKSTSKGKSFLSGKIDGRKVVVFANKNKKSEKHPDFHVLLSNRQESQEKPAPEEDDPWV